MHDDLTDPQHHLRDFIVTNFYIPDGQPLDEVTSFLDAGIIDSTGVLELVGFIETEFAIPVADAEIVPENLDSIATITAYVTGKQADTAKSEAA